MKPFKALTARLVNQDRPAKPTITVSLAIENLDERCLPSVSPLSMGSPHLIKQVEVRHAALPAPEASNPAAIIVGHHWEVAEVHDLGSEASKPESAALLEQTNTVRFFG